MSKTQLVYGVRPVIEALKAGKEFEKIYIQNGLQGAIIGELRELLKQYSYPIQYVPVERLNKFTSNNHQGIVGVISVVTYYSIQDIVPQLFESGKTPFILMLDRVTDVRNLGAIARTAECAGVDAIVIPAKGSAQINEDGIKTSAGALLRVPVCKEENLKTVIHFAKQSGLQVCAATERGNITYTEVNFTLPTLLIMGSEENGVSSEYLKLTDVKTCLPMYGTIASLNVSVAAGIFMYEVVRQRN